MRRYHVPLGVRSLALSSGRDRPVCTPRVGLVFLTEAQRRLGDMGPGHCIRATGAPTECFIPQRPRQPIWVPDFPPTAVALPLSIQHELTQELPWQRPDGTCFS